MFREQRAQASCGVPVLAIARPEQLRAGRYEWMVDRQPVVRRRKDLAVDLDRLDRLDHALASQGPARTARRDPGRRGEFDVGGHAASGLMPCSASSFIT